MRYQTLQGLEKGFDYKKVLKAFKKGGHLNCNWQCCACSRLSLAQVTLLDESALPELLWPGQFNAQRLP